MLSVVVLEGLSPIRTVLGLPVRKSRIQVQSDVFRPSKLSFLVRCWGMIVLNAELKSMNSILT